MSFRYVFTRNILGNISLECERVHYKSLKDASVNDTVEQPYFPRVIITGHKPESLVFKKNWRKKNCKG